MIDDGLVSSRALQEVVDAALESSVARVPPVRPVVERFPEQTHPGLLQPAAALCRVSPVVVREAATNKHFQNSDFSQDNHKISFMDLKNLLW